MRAVTLAAWLAFTCATAAVASSQHAPETVTTAPRATTSAVLIDQHPLAKRQDTNDGASSSTPAPNIPENAAAGGLTYTKPAITDPISYYKIAPSNPITIGWNYTSLYVTPSSLTFEAYCSANSFTYPVGPTNGIPASDTQIVWDPWQYAQSGDAIPFAQASYTLRVYDERGRGAAASAGYFNGANSILYFALYSPAAYTPLSQGWRCVTCSLASVSVHLSHPLVVALPITAALILIGGSSVLYR